MIVCDETRLRVLCEPVKDLTGEGLKLAAQLHRELDASLIEGVGLAAIQIGVPKQAFVVQAPGRLGKLAYSFVNPEILERSEPVIVEEGCLSFPGKEVETLRFNRILIRDAFAPLGRRFVGLEAVVCQHESDHCFGITMYDRALDKIGLEAPCPCGSEKTFKKCCRKKARKF